MARETGESFGQRLRRHRRERRLTQEELDGRSGISARAISDLERGGVESRVATVGRGIAREDPRVRTPG